MKEYKPGYRALLALTVVFTMGGIATVTLASLGMLTLTGHPAAMAVVLAPFLLAGVTCIVRKRFFTAER